MAVVSTEWGRGLNASENMKMILNALYLGDTVALQTEHHQA